MELEAVWYDNRPCDRLNPTYRRRFIVMVVALLVPGTVAIYVATFAAGGRTIALPFAIAFGSIFGALAVFLELTGEARFPLAISFGRSGLTWRTRQGRSYSCPYERVLRVLPSRFDGDWSDRKCMRYFILLRSSARGIGWYISLTPENKDRLDQALKPST